MLSEPVAWAGGDRVVVRGPGADDGSVLGGAIVLDAAPHRRSRRDARRALLAALAVGDGDRVLRAVLDEASPMPLDPSSVRRRLSVPAEVLASAVSRALARGDVVALGECLLPRRTLDELADAARDAVEAHVRAAPLSRGLPLATLEESLAARAGIVAARAAIRAARAKRSADDERALSVEGDVVVSGPRGPLDPRVRALLDAIDRALLAAGVRGLSLPRLAEGAHASEVDARAALAALERRGGAVRAGDTWFCRAAVDAARARLVAHLDAEGAVTTSAFKDLIGAPRNQAVSLLEYFDAANVTRRVGDARVLFRGEGP
jgi:selenocysteine-specific elongation factor